MAGSLIRTIEIWRRHDGATAIRCLCLEDIDTAVFWVKSADDEAAELALDSMIFEHDQEIEIRRWSSSIRAALAAFDRDFENTSR